MGHLDCRRLLDRCIESNDEGAWEELLRRLQGRLLSGVRRGLARAGVKPAVDRVEDLLQEVYCRLLERQRSALRACRGGSEGEIAAFLMRVAENVTLDALRREAAVKRGGKELVLSAHESVVQDRLASSELEAEERIHLARLRERFRRCCRELCHDSPRNRRIVEAAFLEGWTSPEIVRGLASELKVASVDSLLHRVRRRFAEHGIELPSRFAGRPRVGPPALP